jgi:hypothetical protein
MASLFLVRPFSIAAGVAALCAFVGFACGGDKDVASAKLPEGVRSGAINHEACDEGGGKVEVVDVHNDGKHDIKRIFKNGKEVCRISDLNRDGKPDMFEYYDQNGQLRRREADYDDNGIVNAIEFYENGKLVRAELDTTNQGRIDTWDYFDPATGKRIKRERDATGDGRIDQWWTYDGDKVTIAMDKNGDGQPDPESIITLGAGGQVLNTTPDGGPTAPAGGDAGYVSAIPTPTATTPSPSPTDGPAMNKPDAGTPKRGGAKR